MTPVMKGSYTFLCEKNIWMFPAAFCLCSTLNFFMNDMQVGDGAKCVLSFVQPGVIHVIE
jgi:hypothetical protein